MKDSNSFKKMIRSSGFIMAIIFTFALLALPSWAANTGAGTLTVTDDGLCSGMGFSNFKSPKAWDVFQDETIHINISPGFNICTSAPENLLNMKCDVAGPSLECTANQDKGMCQSNNANCQTNSGICTGACSAGNVNAACTTNASCNVSGTCSAGKTCLDGTTSCTSDTGCAVSNRPCSKKCTAGNVGAACTSDVGCNVSGTCSFALATCTTGLLIGNACTTNANCTNQTCASGLQAGQTCTVNGDCTYLACKSNSPGNANGACTTDIGCSINVGTCELALECEDDTSVFIVGTDGTMCEDDTDCSGQGAACDRSCDSDKCNTNNNTCNFTGVDCTVDADCTTKQCSVNGEACVADSDCAGFCTFKDEVMTSGRSGNGAIDVCYETRSSMCLSAQVLYCGMDFEANVNNPPGSMNYSAAVLRPVASTDGNACTMDEECAAPGALDAVCQMGTTCDSPITQCGVLLADCTNEVGSYCCGLGQGAYGAPNSWATALNGETYGQCAGADLGFLPAAKCAGCDAFAGDPNATTMGIHMTRAVTINNLETLIAYLPSSGTPGKFNTSLVGSDTHYGTIPDPNPSGTNSKGQGGGTLAGQVSACQLNTYLSNCTPPFGGANDSFTASGFEDFQLPLGGLVCTKSSGPDKCLGTGDDICRAFGYPACVAEMAVSDVHACANYYLAYGSNGGNPCTCTATELTLALDNINTQFNGCGYVITCPEDRAGTCESNVCTNTMAACTMDSDCNVPGVFDCPM